MILRFLRDSQLIYQMNQKGYYWFLRLLNGTTHCILLSIKTHRRRQCAQEIALSTGGRNVGRWKTRYISSECWGTSNRCP